MPYNIGVLLGDDIGLEVVPEAVRVMQASLAGEADLDVRFHEFPIGWAAYLEYGHTLPPQTLDGLRNMDGFVLGPLGHAAYPEDEPNCINAQPLLRRQFDLYANMRPTRSYAELPSIHQDVDLLIVRENQEGFPPDRNMLAGCGEFQPTQDSACSIRVITRQRTERIARAAFEAARQRGGKRRVTAIHKRTLFKLTDGLFMRTVESVAEEFPDITLDSYQIDTFSMHLVMRPQQFDVILCTNLYGDILSDQAAGIVGGLGMAPGLNVSDTQAMAQATHGSAPDIAGKGLANPYALIMSGQMLLEWLGARRQDRRMQAAARRITMAVQQNIREGVALTRDLGGSATTEEMGMAIAEACRKL